MFRDPSVGRGASIAIATDFKAGDYTRLCKLNEIPNHLQYNHYVYDLVCHSAARKAVFCAIITNTPSLAVRRDGVSEFTPNQAESARVLIWHMCHAQPPKTSDVKFGMFCRSCCSMEHVSIVSGSPMQEYFHAANADPRAHRSSSLPRGEQNRSDTLAIPPPQRSRDPIP